jgi:hypothetical protein
MVGDGDTPILARAYAERQLIVVTADQIAQAVQAQKPGTLEDDQKFIGRLKNKALAHLDLLKSDWKGFEQSVKEKKWKKATKSFVAFYLDLAHSNTLNMATVESLRAWARATESGVKILPIGKTAAAAITFPPGHPRNGVLYIGHPTMATVYYPMADFHRVTFEHKFCEAIELLMSLGARQIRVEHVTGWSKDFSTRIFVPLGQASGSATMEAGRHSANQRTVLYEASLVGTDNPTIPENLVWYKHEPTWQTVLKGRIKFGMKDFSLSVAYEDDFGINAGLKAQVANAGLDLGGKFEDHQSTVWRLEGKF